MLPTTSTVKSYTRRCPPHLYQYTCSHLPFLLPYPFPFFASSAAPRNSHCHLPTHTAHTCTLTWSSLTCTHQHHSTYIWACIWASRLLESTGKTWCSFIYTEHAEKPIGSPGTHIVPLDEALALAEILLHLGGLQDGCKHRHSSPSLTLR